MLQSHLFIKYIISSKKKVSKVKMVVGLGNPGKIYENTRHNIGFLFLDSYLEGAVFKSKFSALYCEKMVNHQKVLFLKPQTFMNNSGQAVAAFANFYKIKPQDILVISDDLDLPLGTYRLRSHGSSGGHNGLKSIEENLKSRDYQRLRIGIAAPECKTDTIDYVLGKLTSFEEKSLQSLKSTIFAILDDYPNTDFTELMNLYNHRK